MLDRSGPLSLTISMTAPKLPSDVADRLPKALIHRNAPGERIYALLRDLGCHPAHRGTARLFGSAPAVLAAVHGLLRWGGRCWASRRDGGSAG